MQRGRVCGQVCLPVRHMIMSHGAEQPSASGVVQSGGVQLYLHAVTVPAVMSLRAGHVMCVCDVQQCAPRRSIS